jgi:NAD(P)-dependent dehydrogenase (short-subunit alcohol dehydrogenase family)
LEISLKGKVAWVTGASGGIGSSIVQNLHDAGCTVVSTDLADKPAIAGERIVHRRCDITQQEDIDAVASFCRDELGGIDILCNNAAILRRLDIFEMTREMWDQTMEVNLKAYFFCAQAAAKLMRDQGRGGSIVNTVSINSDFVPSHGNTVPYCASKGGVRTLTFALAVALAPHGIRVNGISPGTVVTNLSQGRLTPSERAATEAKTPLGRLGLPRDIGPAVLYLVSDQASFVTGAILPIHGGRTLPA